MLFCLYALINSGTRAAFIFAVIFIVTFHLTTQKSIAFIRFVLMFACALAVIFFAFGLQEISEFFRIQSSFSKFTSNRLIGISGLIELFLADPIVGQGFGQADNDIGVNPTNTFYFALPAEVGIFGCLGAFGIIFLPIGIMLRMMIKNRRMSIHQNASAMQILSGCFLVAFVPYLVFEFPVFRISAINQFFFFWWGMYVFQQTLADQNPS